MSHSTSQFSCKYGVTDYLTSRNYHTWTRSIKAFLIAEEAWKIVNGTERPPNARDATQIRDYERRSGRAYAMIYSSSDESTRALIDSLPDEDPKSVWDALKKSYDTTTSLSGRLATLRRFQQARMKPNTSVAQYISTLINIRLPLVGSGESISDHSLIGHLLATLPSEFDNIIGILENKPADQLTLDTVTTARVGAENTIALRNAEVGSNTNIASTLITGNALAASAHPGQRGKPRGGYGRHNGGEHRRWTPYSGQQRKAESYPILCFYCMRPGHRREDCFLRKRAVDYEKTISDPQALANSAYVQAGEVHDQFAEVHGF
jgi:hypothetical protein